MTTSIITNQDERFARATWSAMTEPGDTNASAVVTDLGYIDALDAVTNSVRAAELGERSDDMARAVKLWRGRYRTENITQLLSDADNLGIHLVDPLSVRGMSDLGERAPHLLWVRGDVTALDAAQALTWSGARAASAYGESVTSEIVTDLATLSRRACLKRARSERVTASIREFGSPESAGARERVRSESSGDARYRPHAVHTPRPTLIVTGISFRWRRLPRGHRRRLRRYHDAAGTATARPVGR